MRKITNFIIDKRYIILVVVAILTVISGFLSKSVSINYEISEYLPSTSETKIGLNIMEEKFAEIKSSSLNLMFAGLFENEKTEVLEYLESIDGVSSIDYDETEDYNKDNYTLYVVNVDDLDDSELASSVYENIKEHFADYEMYTSGDIAESNEPVLPMWIMVLAVGCALVILMVMCESYLEPILFLISILIAVILNMGTNIIFDSVSNITNSITAILQMALSMDYSIMLMDRYRQESEREKDKVKAMKSALYNAFTAISSSSVTTIVGLLALVFMSFTIGRDLGFVLAKGVLLSLVCVFLILPTLILSCDKLIKKTTKKTPNIKLNKLGACAYSFRYVAGLLFIAAFIGSYFLKGNLDVLYTNSQDDEISEVFEENNQMVLVYKTEDEGLIASYLGTLEEKSGVDTVTGYSNTINEEKVYSELNEKISALGADVEIDDYLLKIIYYNYYNSEEDNTINLEEFTNFIENEVYRNVTLSNSIDENAKSEISKLANFTTSSLITKERGVEEIASILEMEKSDVEAIFIYYNSKNNNLKLELNEFINFVSNDVLTDDTYSSSIDSSNIDALNSLAKFTDKSTITKRMTSEEMASLFGMDSGMMSDLYTYYVNANEIDTKMTINEFASFVLNDVLTDDSYASLFDEKTIQNVEMLITFSDVSMISKNMTVSELASLLGLDEEIVKQVLYLDYGTKDNGTKMTLFEFIDMITYLKTNTSYLDSFDISSFSMLDDSFLSDESSYTATEMADILSIDASQMYQIYGLIDLVNDNTNSWEMSLVDFVNLILANSDNFSVSENLGLDVASSLQLASNIMNSSINNVSYSYLEISEFVGIDNDIIKSIYALYVTKNMVLKITPQEFVCFILNHRDDSVLKASLSTSEIEQLTLLQIVMSDVINNKTYTYEELSNLLGLEPSDVSLLYGLYISCYNQNQTMSLQNFVNFILNDVLENEDYSGNFTDDSKSVLRAISEIMTVSLSGVKLSKGEVYSKLNILSDELDSTMVDLIYMYYGSINQYDESWTLTIENFVNFICDEILTDSRFDSFIELDMKESIANSKEQVNDAKDLLIGDGYSRLIINTKLALESDETFAFIQSVKDDLGKKISDFYILGDSPMAYEMSQTFQDELNFITILTMAFIFIVVAITFKSIVIPVILVLLIQTAIYMIMGILSFSGDGVYFIALLIVQSILMGATIDYAILYTSYYIENRKVLAKKEAIKISYNKSINTIVTSASILIIVTFIVGLFSSGITSMICMTLSQGTLCSALLILLLLPAVLCAGDKFVIKKSE